MSEMHLMKMQMMIDSPVLINAYIIKRAIMTGYMVINKRPSAVALCLPNVL